MRSVVEIGASVPAFLGKLWKLVNDSETNHLISWSPGGKTFVIKNQADFARELLPLYYKHNNMASFIRQLNMYGFHKITSVENGGLRYEKDDIEFSHPCFMRGYAYLLEHIKRKIANSKSIVSSDSGEKILLKPELMNKVLADVKQMKGKQESLDAKFSAMKQENEALWREVAMLRQKHIKQQHIVNNLIQFLMSLVQPTRTANANGNNMGVKRPYQLMINNAAHNSATDSSYPGKTKNIRLDKDILEDVNEDNLEDGPTIHELVHDDILPNEESQESLDPSNFVTIEVPTVSTDQSSVDPAGAIQYHVTMEDADDPKSGSAKVIQFYPVYKLNNSPQTLDSTNSLPVTSSTSAVNTPASPEQVSNTTTSLGKSKSKSRSVNKSSTQQSGKTLMSTSNFNTLNPSADLKLPAEIFASDDSASEVAIPVTEVLPVQNILQDTILNTNNSSPLTKDKMLGGIKLEKPMDGLAKSDGKSKKSNKDYVADDTINIADIKTEMQDDWSNMTLATVNNNTNVNRFQTRDDIDDHLDTMQSDLESLRELLRGDGYSLDTNTLMGNADASLGPTMSFTIPQQTANNYLFGADDPFYGLSFNMDERAKSSNSAKKHKGEISNVSSDENRVEDLYTEDDAEENQLISYTGNVPNFDDINMPELEADNSQDACVSPTPCSSTLNTPQVEVRSPSNWRLRP
ncbi:heat shock factor protein 1 isoform X3 [Galleria mellonella]|uniref:Heat shock factor protein 1 isoform X3 n=1 Tax=Galleria mellonella TaxID=7137 RepID=A0A6J1WTW6_GALME|nr:heat shock factor protein 1 isoform X3 [Galleria mellonella]